MIMDASEPTAGINDARKLEEINFIQWISEAAAQRETDLKASERRMAARGFAQSGGRFIAEADIMFASIEHVVDKVIRCRKELSARVPALLTQTELDALQDRLNRYVDSGVSGLRVRSDSQLPGAAVHAFGRRAERRAHSVKARINQGLAALQLEAKLGIHKTGEPNVPTLKISNSTIANLNLGNVVGDLNSSIQQLNVEGRDELAERLTRMTEAIAASEHFDEDLRRELLEHLAVVSGEAAAPPEKRKMGPLKTSLRAIKAAMPVASQLLALWHNVEQTLNGMGIHRR